MSDLSRYDGRTPEPPYETPDPNIDYRADELANVVIRMSSENALLRARIAELEDAGTVAMRLLLQGYKDEALKHLQNHLQA